MHRVRRGWAGENAGWRCGCLRRDDFSWFQARGLWVSVLPGIIPHTPLDRSRKRVWPQSITLGRKRRARISSRANAPASARPPPPAARTEPARIVSRSRSPRTEASFTRVVKCSGPSTRAWKVALGVRIGAAQAAADRVAAALDPRQRAVALDLAGEDVVLARLRGVMQLRALPSAPRLTPRCCICCSSMRRVSAGRPLMCCCSMPICAAMSGRPATLRRVGGTPTGRARIVQRVRDRWRRSGQGERGGADRGSSGRSSWFGVRARKRARHRRLHYRRPGRATTPRPPDRERILRRHEGSVRRTAAPGVAGIGTPASDLRRACRTRPGPIRPASASSAA